MAGWKDISEIWNTIQEFDLRPIRDAALLPMRIAIVGVAGCGRRELADAMRRDPALPIETTQTPVMVLTLEEAASLSDVDLVLVVAQPAPASLAAARAVSLRCTNVGLRNLLICRLPNATEDEKVLAFVESAPGVLKGAFEDQQFLLKKFVPAVLAQIPESQHMALGRQFPLFRTTVARALVDDTCMANAVYAFSTGLAEAIPVFTIPLSVADMVVLTKSQAFLAYKLGLLLGFSTQWQDYLTEFGSVVGSGFVMRQLARQLISLIPGWGIAPKVVIAFSGTYVVGHTVLQWYLAGRTIHKEKLKSLYKQAILEGKIIAFRIIEKAPRIKLPRKPQKSLPAETNTGQAEIVQKPPRFKLGWRRKAPHQICPACAKMNSPEAAFCQYCGQALASSPPPAAPIDENALHS
jgi:uncharacterized protein (DUF697 family)